MRYHQAIIAIVLAVTWITTVLHAGLEANGWIPEHDHVASHAHSHAGDENASHEDAHSHPQPATGEAAHDTVVARSSTSEGRPILWLLALCASLIGAVFWFALAFHPRVLSAPPPPRWREEHALTRWCFVWRCASFTTAPPRLV